MDAQINENINDLIIDMKASAAEKHAYHFIYDTYLLFLEARAKKVEVDVVGAAREALTDSDFIEAVRKEMRKMEENEGSQGIKLSSHSEKSDYYKVFSMIEKAVSFDAVDLV